MRLQTKEVAFSVERVPLMRANLLVRSAKRAKVQ